MKSEFEKLTGACVNDDTYRVIEYVYMYHPVIDPVKGKQQIADLWKIGGFGLMADMIPTAKRAEKLERKIRDLQDELDTVRGHLNDLKYGEYAIRELEREID